MSKYISQSMPDTLFLSLVFNVTSYINSKVLTSLKITKDFLTYQTFQIRKKV